LWLGMRPFNRHKAVSLDSSWILRATIGHMADSTRLTAIIERDCDGYVALCPEYDIASQGDTIEEARANLVEALTLFFECADPAELSRRFKTEVLVTQVEVKVP